MERIRGTLSPIQLIRGTLSQTGSLISATLTIPERIATEMYDGDYDVIPTFELQTLQTRDKTMADNVTVQAIEVSRVSNPAGGKTVYIGGNING